MNNPDTISVVNKMQGDSTDVLILLGAIAAVAMIVVFCVIYFRKDEKRRRRSHRHHHHRKSYREQIQKTTSGIKEIIRQRRRRHRHEHRALNPTLAQTGGLPPLREEGKLPPPP